MPSVETVNGAIDVEDLGLTLIHEHCTALEQIAVPLQREIERGIE